MLGLAQLAAGDGETDDWVLIHDAARCLIAPPLTDQLIDTCHSDPVGLLAQPVPTPQTEPGWPGAGSVSR
jgi:2-C-methyl-D-erythritol 4-phosphate cytidylyltransferase